MYIPIPVLESRNESGFDIRRPTIHEHVSVIEGVKEFPTELEAHILSELDVFVDTQIGIPESGTAESILLGHVRRERPEFAGSDNRVDVVAWRLSTQVNEIELIGVAGAGRVIINYERKRGRGNEARTDLERGIRAVRG